MIIESLAKEKLLDEYSAPLDWLLSCSFFDSKNKKAQSQVACFTRTIHKELGYRQNDIIYGAIKNIKFPKRVSKSTKPCLILGRSQSEGRDTLRHLRNSLAHGRMSLSKIRGKHYIDAFDYSSNLQSAYIHIPLVWLKKYYLIYKKSL